MGLLDFFFPPKNYETIGPDEFGERMKTPKTVVLDVRSAAEFSSGKIPGAVNIDVGSPDFLKKINLLDQSNTFLIYCRSGMRSANACNTMSNLGFENVVNLRNGILGWNGKVV